MKLVRKFAALVLAGVAAPAVAGPPYLTDDPVPTDTSHWEIYAFTGGEGHLDKLCMELCGMESSRNRPPIRDIRPKFREKARQMLKKIGVPHCK